jgi:DNA-binding beta-propeller fold protein YncE
MKRSERFAGSDAPFEGDRTLWVRSIPVGAQLSSALLTLTPVAAAGRPLFEESITFSGAVGTLGATQSRNDAGSRHWTELDFHQRRTVTQITGGDLSGAEVQIDLGGVYVRLNDVGAPFTPGDAGKLTLGTDGALPGLSANKIKLTAPAKVLPVNRVTLRSVPLNLTARAGAQPAFWARPGELSQPVSTPDVAVALQTALAGAPVEGGFHRLPLVIHSDTLCRLDVLLSLEFTLEKPALPGDLTESTVTFDLSGAPAAPVATLAVPVGAQLVATPTRARALGAFQQTRIGYGPIGPVEPVGALALTADQSLAVPVTVEQALDATAVDLLLAATTPTVRLQLNVFADTDGKPFNQPLLSKPAEIAVERGEDPAAHWVSGKLPELLTLAPGDRYWFTLQIAGGAAAWSVLGAGAPPGTQRSRDGGLSWRQADLPEAPLTTGLLRLRTVPDRFTMPIRLRAGTGATAHDVALDRFAPLGRVEIDLNAPEIIDGINTALATAGADPAPTGEHIRNGDFSLWSRTADLPDGSRTIATAMRARRFAVADDCVAFVAGDVIGSAGHVLGAIDVYTDGLDEIAASIEDDLIGLAADPDADLAYLLTGGSVLTYDVRTGNHVTAGLLHTGVAIAVTPNGATVLVATAGDSSLVSFSSSQNRLAAVAADAIRAGGDKVWGVDADLDAAPVDIAVSGDGKTVWVLTDDEGISELVAFDVDSVTPTGVPVLLGHNATRLGVSANGRYAAAVHPKDSAISVLDIQTGDITRIDLTAEDSPDASAVTLTADGGYLFVALRAAKAVALVDRRAGQVLRRIPVGDAPEDCAISRDGARLYVADTADGPGFTVITIGTLLPDDWVVTAGAVQPSCSPPGGRVAVVGASGQTNKLVTSALAQVVPVAPDRRYELNVQALATDEGATAELHWYTGTCAESRMDSVPIIAPKAQLGTAVRQVSLQPHRIATTAPGDANQVEVRFHTPPGISAVVDQVSLRVDSNVLPNANLSVSAGVLTGWSLSPPSPSGFEVTTAVGGLVLHNGSGVTVTVSQSADVLERENYRLTVEGSATSGAPGLDPSVVLQWTRGGLQIGEVFTVPMTADAGSPVVRVASTPDGADGVDTRLISPPGTELRLTRIALDHLATTRLPVTFIAEAPGELTLTGWQVDYDLPDAPRVPPTPASGLCRPGRPEPVPGERPEERSYCPTCQGEHQMVDPQPTVTAGDLAGTRLTCANCGAAVTLPGVVAGRSVVRVVTPVRPNAMAIAGGGFARLFADAAPAPAPPGLDAIDGIGPATVQRLADMGIFSVADLAAVEPARLAAVPRMTPAKARSWIHRAKTLLRVGNGLDPA